MNARPVCFSLLLVAVSLPIAAKASAKFEHLHQENCVRCHGSEVYTRSDRMVTSLPALNAQVRRCELNLGLRWFDEEIAGVADYLNENYYKFTP